MIVNVRQNPDCGCSLTADLKHRDIVGKTTMQNLDIVADTIKIETKKAGSLPIRWLSRAALRIIAPSLAEDGP